MSSLFLRIIAAPEFALWARRRKPRRVWRRIGFLASAANQV
jgi:hypothetical protein